MSLLREAHQIKKAQCGGKIRWGDAMQKEKNRSSKTGALSRGEEGEREYAPLSVKSGSLRREARGEEIDLCG